MFKLEIVKFELQGVSFVLEDASLRPPKQDKRILLRLEGIMLKLKVVKFGLQEVSLVLEGISDWSVSRSDGRFSFSAWRHSLSAWTLSISRILSLSGIVLNMPDKH